MNKLALDLGVEIHMDSGVARYDPDIPSLTLENGATYSADLIVAADGLCVLTHGALDSGR